MSRREDCYHGPDCLECNGWPTLDDEDAAELADTEGGPKT